MIGLSFQNFKVAVLRAVLVFKLCVPGLDRKVRKFVEELLLNMDCNSKSPSFS